MREEDNTPGPDDEGFEDNEDNQAKGDPNATGQEPGRLGKPSVPLMKLISYQLRGVVRNHHCGNDEYQALVNGTFDLFASLRPKDPVGAVLAALAVGLHNQTMELMATTDSRDRELRLKYSIRGAATIDKLLAHYERRQRKT